MPLFSYSKPRDPPGSLLKKANAVFEKGGAVATRSRKSGKTKGGFDPLRTVAATAVLKGRVRPQFIRL